MKSIVHSPHLHSQPETVVFFLLRRQSICLVLQVSRLQAAIAEAAAQVGITVSWCPPSFANSGLQEEFEEMGAWLSRISDTLHELCRERRRLMVCVAFSVASTLPVPQSRLCFSRMRRQEHIHSRPYEWTLQQMLSSRATHSIQRCMHCSNCLHAAVTCRRLTGRRHKDGERCRQNCLISKAPCRSCAGCIMVQLTTVTTRVLGPRPALPNRMYPLLHAAHLVLAILCLRRAAQSMCPVPHWPTLL